MVLETQLGQPSTVCYLCDGLTIVVDITEILSIYIADPPTSLPELDKLQSKEYCYKQILETVVKPGSCFHVYLDGSSVRCFSIYRSLRIFFNK